MDFWYFPTANTLLNTFLRSCVLFVVLVFGFKKSYYQAYWYAIVHDAISLSLKPV